MMMIDKLRKRLNNSASLGKTLARTQQPHLSYFAEPKEFDLRSLNDNKLQSKKSRKDPISTPKHASGKAVPANLCMADSLINIQLNRQRCGKLSQEVHTAAMVKSLHVNRMYKDLHHFQVCVEELRWLLGEGDTLIRAYLAQTTLVAPNSPHTLDIANISQEFRSLVLRFAQIDRERLAGIEDCLRTVVRVEDVLNARTSLEGLGALTMTEDLKLHEVKPLQTFPEGYSIISSKEQGRDSEVPSFLETRHFSVPLKENINNSNFPNFENIKIAKTEFSKTKQNSGTTQKQTQHQSHQHQSEPQSMMMQQIKQTMTEKIQQLQKEKEELYRKLRQEHEKNETLIGNIQMLKEQIASLERKLSTYKVTSRKSVEKLGEILKRLMSGLSHQEKQFQLLRMAQSISCWEKMIEDDLQEAKYRQLYGHPDACQGEKTQQLKEIIELQYEISTLALQKQHLERMVAAEIDKNSGKNEVSEQMYRMLIMQAITLQQLCNL